MLQAWLLSHAFRREPSWVSQALAPVALVYGALQGRAARRADSLGRERAQPDRPVIVIGNYVVGGAGKTPVTIALVRALQAAGHRPGVVSRGHGRRKDELLPVEPHSTADDVGDEPLLIRRRTGAPVLVGRDRRQAALELIQRHPELTVVVCDDGLQHRALQRQLAIVVFDERGIGNGRLLPSGPLREPLPQAPPSDALVVYSHGERSTHWPGWPGWPLHRRLAGACALSDWLAGRVDPAPLAELKGREQVAVAGIAVPERFFGALERAGLTIRRMPQRDHARYTAPPWPADAVEVLVTEKDAVKLARWSDSGPTVRVVPLDLDLPPDLVAAVLQRLPPPAARP